MDFTISRSEPSRLAVIGSTSETESRFTPMGKHALKVAVEVPAFLCSVARYCLQRAAVIFQPPTPAKPEG